MLTFRGVRADVQIVVRDVERGAISVLTLLMHDLAGTRSCNPLTNVLRIK
jgi:hypothetical protein